MVSYSCCVSHFRCKLRAVEHTKMMFFHLDTDTRGVPTTVAPHTDITNSSYLTAGILAILSIGRASQIGKFVVCSVVIFMI